MAANDPANADYDERPPVQPERRKGGRPTLPEDEKLESQVTIALTKELHDRLCALSATTGTPIAALVRQWIVERIGGPTGVSGLK